MAEAGFIRGVECIEAAVCVGGAGVCPAGKRKADGSVCLGGTCKAGVCVQTRSDAGPAVVPGDGEASTSDDSGCSVASERAQPNSAALALALGLLLLIRRRTR